MSIRTTIAVVGLCLAGPLSAQGNGVEIGFDGVIQRQLSEDAGKFTIVALPGGTVIYPFAPVRVGIPVASRLRLEPGVGFGLLHVDGFDDDFKSWQLMLGGVYDFGSRSDGMNPFIRPFIAYSTVGDTDPSNWFEFGLGVGARLPIADRLAARFELNYAHALENEDDYLPSQDFINLRFGVSMFTK